MIKDYTEISTKAGDKGTTSNYSGRCIQKTDLLFESLGAIDELSSSIGIVANRSGNKAVLQSIQKDLQVIMSLVATDPQPDLDAIQFVPTNPTYIGLKKIEDLHIQVLERLEQVILNSVTIKAEFVLPGQEGIIASLFDMARAICRRAERSLLRFRESAVRLDLEMSIKYMNRLSDLLFLYARKNS